MSGLGTAAARGFRLATSVGGTLTGRGGRPVVRERLHKTSQVVQMYALHDNKDGAPWAIFPVSRENAGNFSNFDRLGGGSFVGARAVRGARDPKAATGQRRVLGPIPASACAALCVEGPRQGNGRRSQKATERRGCESVGMAQSGCVLPPAEDRERLLANRRGSQSSARTCAVGAHHSVFGRPPACAGSGAVRGRQRTRGLARAGAIRWAARRGLSRDKTRKPARAPLSATVVAKVMDLTCSEPPGYATHWTA